MPQPLGLQPGVYVGLSMDAYHADPAIGSSGIKHLKESAELYRYNSPLNPTRPKKESTAAMTFGTAYHTLVLEPEKFAGQYAIKKGVKSSGVDGMIGEGDYEKMKQMYQGLLEKPEHFALLNGGVPECSIFWRDERTGLMCKMRCDMLAPGWISDLKTTDDISSSALRYSFVNYGYDISGVMYSMGAQALRKMIKEGYKLPPEFSEEFAQKFMATENQIFAFIYQDKNGPFLTRCWLVTPWLAEIGKAKFEQGLDVYLAHIDGPTPWPSGYDTLENITEDMLSQSINY